MDMRIKFKVSTEGMENHRNAWDVGFIFSGPCSDSNGSQCEHGIEKYFSVKKDKDSEFFRQGKYKMLIRGVGKLGQTGFYPAVSG